MTCTDMESTSLDELLIRVDWMAHSRTRTYANKEIAMASLRKSNSTHESPSQNHSQKLRMLGSRRRLSHTEFLTAIFALTLKSGFALKVHLFT